MRILFGFVCLGVWTILLGVGILYPTVGADAGLVIDLAAFTFYMALVWGMVWGFGGEIHAQQGTDG